jgi:hypothetical protein
MRIESNSDLFSSINQLRNSLNTSKEFSEVEILTQQCTNLFQEIETKNSSWISKIKAGFSKILGNESDGQRLERKFVKLEDQYFEDVRRLSLLTDINIANNSFSNMYELPTEKTNLMAILESEQAKFYESALENSEELIPLIQKMESIESKLAKIERLGNQKTFNVDHLVSFTENFMLELSEMESLLLELTYKFRENRISNRSIVPLVIRYELALIFLNEICHNGVPQKLNKTPDNIFNKKLSKIGKIEIGGIDNGSNTCYLASAVQVLNNIPAYRKAFDPKENHLKKWDKESYDSLKLRKQIQASAFQILENINKGIKTSGHEIHGLRKLCYVYKAPDNASIVESLHGMADSAETLQRLLEAMNYKFGSYHCILNIQPESEFTIIENADPTRYSTIEEMNKVETGADLEVSGFPYLGNQVPMQQLINEFWSDEILPDCRINEKNEEGNYFVKQYKSTKKSKQPSFENPPEVIRITVKQADGNKAKIQNPRKIHLFGFNRGPLYHLKAMIEHRHPGHYVAHIVDKRGNIIEANDSDMYESHETLPGFAYYYVKEENAVLQKPHIEEDSCDSLMLNGSYM